MRLVLTILCFCCLAAMFPPLVRHRPLLSPKASDVSSKLMAVPAPRPMSYALTWTRSPWPNEIVYEVWAQWPAWQTQVVAVQAGVVTNPVTHRVVTNSAGWRTNVAWTFAPPSLWQTVATNWLPLEVRSNSGGLFRVRARDTSTGEVSDWAKT